MRRAPAAILIALLPLLCVSIAAGGAKEEYYRHLAEEKIRDAASSAAELVGLPVVQVKNLRDVFTLSIHNKDFVLHATTQPTDGTVLHVPGMGSWSKLKVIGKKEGRDFVMQLFSFENRDFSAPGAIAVYTMLDYVAGEVHLTQMSEAADSGDLYNVQLIQHVRGGPIDQPHVTLDVQITSPPGTTIKLSADNVVDMRREHPEEIARYVDPILSTLQLDGLLARVDPRLAWQVFPEVSQPTPALEQKVKSLIAQFDSESFQKREAASSELDKLGQPAALLLAKQSRAGLSTEQKQRIDAFIAKYRTVSTAEAARLKDDPSFLIDCLSCDELPLRTAALHRLEKVLGKTISFDLNADLEHRLMNATALRQKLENPPTTSP